MTEDIHLYECDECGKQVEQHWNNGCCQHCGGEIVRVKTGPELLPGMYIPDKIYLQFEDMDGEPTDEWTWCVDRIHDTDVEYIRKKEHK